MSYPPPPGQEGNPPAYDGTQGYGGQPGYGTQPVQPIPGADSYWAGNVPPADPPVVAYQPPSYPVPGAGYPTPGYGYGAPYGYLGQYAPTRTTDGFAIASLVVSCVAALSLCAYGIGGVLGVVGAIFGHVAKRRIRNAGTSGDGLALAGIIVGWIAAFLGLVAIALFVTFIVMGESSNNY